MHSEDISTPNPAAVAFEALCNSANAGDPHAIGRAIDTILNVMSLGGCARADALTLAEHFARIGVSVGAEDAEAKLAGILVLQGELVELQTGKSEAAAPHVAEAIGLLAKVSRNGDSSVDFHLRHFGQGMRGKLLTAVADRTPELLAFCPTGGNA